MDLMARIVRMCWFVIPKGNVMKPINWLVHISLFCASVCLGQTLSPEAAYQFKFNGNLICSNGGLTFIPEKAKISYVRGIEGRAVRFSPEMGYASLQNDRFSLDGSTDFTLQFWVKTTSENPTLLLSQKDFSCKGITAQKNSGWAVYSSGGTFAWSVGSGDRRLTYERDNGNRMPLTDGQWHLLTLTYSKSKAECRLYYDGRNRAVYKVNFDFTGEFPLIIGTRPGEFDYDNQNLPEIEAGAVHLQAVVDEFNRLGIEKVHQEEFISLIVNPEKLYEEKLAKSGGAGLASAEKPLAKVYEARKKLHSNPYSVFQNRELTLLKPISKIYALKGSRVVINRTASRQFTLAEKLYPADFCLDELSILKRVLEPDEIMNSYARFADPEPVHLANRLTALTVGVWNIWHGGIHWSDEKDGWDSRVRIAEMIRENQIDVVLMQETYSSGDFIAAELGYYFATTSDWDYCFQGANISVLSRYPIEEIFVLPETEFNNVAVKLAISKTQSVYAMSNWYGMGQFPAVAEFHKTRFEGADAIPILFGGDFNAVPHTDGGRSLASKTLLDAGFTDAYRQLYPSVQTYPGHSHRSGKRIDQLYYKGAGIENRSTEVLSSWPGGFPSDHFLIVSRFALKY
jgi:endonuclease/exonuclease/phosphatase family metal-dependent hydrolase